MFEYIIGLEIHTKLSTKHKIFCYCENTQDFDNTIPNTHICPTCTAQPGGLPIINPECVHTAIRLGHIFDAELNKSFKRDRKSYFYPDSPVGFQITQYQEPIIKGGTVKFFSKDFQTEYSINIHEAHLENDTAKTITIDGTTYIDFNRCGGPLIEIVTKPEFDNDEQVVEFLKELQRIIRWNEIGFADLEKGQMRVDVNLSIRPTGSKELGTRTEMKNMNSFASIRKAIAYEFARHIQIVSDGGKVDQETRGRDDAKGETYSLRSKEQAHDYRYFTEADLPQVDPSTIDRTRNKNLIKASGHQTIKQLLDFGFHKEYIHGLINNEFLYGWFKKALTAGYDPKVTAKWLLGPIAGIYNEGGEQALKIGFEQFIVFLQGIKKNNLTEVIAKNIMEELLVGNESIESLIQKHGELRIDHRELDSMMNQIIQSNPKAYEDYKGGKVTTIAFFVGQLMKVTKGALDPNTAKELLEKRLSE